MGWIIVLTLIGILVVLIALSEGLIDWTDFLEF